MKSNSSLPLVSIKSNDEVVALFKKSKRVNLPIGTLWISNNLNKAEVNYALLVNKSSFKLAVVRNKIKRQLRNILIQSKINKNICLLIKPNPNYLNKDYESNKTLLINTINKYQNGK